MSKKIKKLLSVVSIILCLTILSSISTEAIAGTIEKSNEDTITTPSFTDIGDGTTVGNIVSEITEERDKYTKHFRLDDGTFMAVKTSINGQTKTITIGTDEDGESYVSNDGVTAKTTTDDFGRTTEVKTSRGEGNSVYFTQYEYADGNAENSTTNLISKLTQKYGADELVNYEYTYDGNGNITEIYENGTLAHKYTYDSLNQLKTEYDYVNLFYIFYSYDDSGNIKAKHEQALHPTYLYPTGSERGNTYYYNDTEWKDKLTQINSYKITYDESGNPLAYRNGMTMTWQNGRQLASLQTEDNEVNYKYDSDGMRTQKTDNSGTTYYYYDSDKNLIGLTKGDNTLLFYYDSDGNVTSFKYGDTMYYYVKNLQGDVVKIINQSGAVYASYVYDAWGNIKSVSGEPILRELNPFRFRSYVYDTESGLYYLQSRYYDPFTGRLLNIDVYCNTQTGSPLSTNMFTYCENNSVNCIDCDGQITRYLWGNKFEISLVGKKELTSKRFVCYLTNEWAKCNKYTKTKTVTIGATVGGEISAGYKNMVSSAINASVTCQVGVSIGQEIPANSKKFSKLAVYAKYYKQNVSVKVYQTKYRRYWWSLVPVPYYAYTKTQKGYVQ